MVETVGKFIPQSNTLEFVADKEPWAQYTLENGAVIRIRVMLVRVANDGIWGRENGNCGLPKLNLGMQQVMDIEWPQDIKDEANKVRRELGMPDV